MLACSLIFSKSKGDFIIEIQIVWLFVHYSECLSHPPSILCAPKIIHTFLNLMISANHKKVLEFQPIVKPLNHLFFLWFKICSKKHKHSVMYLIPINELQILDSNICLHSIELCLSHFWMLLIKQSFEKWISLLCKLHYAFL